MRFSWKPSRPIVAASFLFLAIFVWRREAIGAQLTVTWVDNSTNEAGFSVERSTGTTGTFAEVTTTGSGVTTYIDSSLADVTTYCYRVRAFNAAGYSAYSNVACGTTSQTFGLAVVKIGAGSGTVTSAPVGINCGASCSASYSSGTAVTLTAAPAAGSTFIGWSGGGCSGAGSCTVTLTATTTVTATFDLQPNTLIVSKAGAGSGTVTSAPVGINCGASCSASYSSGTAVTLTAAPAAGSTFTGWSGGGCSGTGSCTVTLTATTTVTATFDLNGSMDPLSFSSATYSAKPQSSKVAITVLRSGPTGTTVSVRYATSDGTATAGVNYLATSGTLKFRPGVIKQTFNVQILTSVLTTPKTIHLTLSKPSAGAGLGTPSAAVLTVTNPPPNGTGPVAAYSFNEGAGTTVADSSGNNNTGTLVNGPIWTGGMYGSALSFDGLSDYVDLGDPVTLQLTGSMTISGWINAALFPVDDAAIVSKRDSGEVGYQLDTTIDAGPRTIGFKLTNASGGYMFRYGASTLQPNQWYHVAGVYDAAAQTLSVYLNGQLDNGLLIGTITATQLNSLLNVNIGRRAGRSGFEFNGLIDEVRIYNRALSPAEIQQDMNTPL